jgi:predicted nuclease of predicted toxin-antitoxin system
MRFLADENVPYEVVEELIAAGHDAEWVGKLSPGAPDGEVLKLAAVDARILMTFDKDYGELAHRSKGMALPTGILLIRSPVPRTRDDCRNFALMIAARDDWAGSGARPARCPITSCAPAPGQCGPRGEWSG